MRLIQSLSATTMTLVLLGAAPVLPRLHYGQTQLAQAAAPVKAADQRLDHAGRRIAGRTASPVLRRGALPARGQRRRAAPSAPPAAAGLHPARSAIAAANSCPCDRMQKKSGGDQGRSRDQETASCLRGVQELRCRRSQSVVKYVEQHGEECRIPADAAKMMKANHAKTLEIRTKVCDVAAAPQPRARA